MFISRLRRASRANKLIGFGLLVGWLATMMASAIVPEFPACLFRLPLSHLSLVRVSTPVLSISLSISAFFFSDAWWSSLVAAWQRSRWNHIITSERQRNLKEFNTPLPSIIPPSLHQLQLVFSLSFIGFINPILFKKNVSSPDTFSDLIGLKRNNIWSLNSCGS